jgi:hypothetical protein
MVPHMRVLELHSQVLQVGGLLQLGRRPLVYSRRIGILFLLRSDLSSCGPPWLQQRILWVEEVGSSGGKIGGVRGLAREFGDEVELDVSSWGTAHSALRVPAKMCAQTILGFRWDQPCTGRLGLLLLFHHDLQAPI